MELTQVIRKPLFTEKGDIAKAKNNVYQFEVNKHTNKVEIKKAIESLYGVKVEDVRTMVSKPVEKKKGGKKYFTPLTKKALVKLAVGEQINLV